MRPTETAEWALLMVLGIGIPALIMTTEPGKLLMAIIAFLVLGAGGAAVAYFSSKKPVRAELQLQPDQLAVDTQQVIGHSKASFPLDMVNGVDIGWTKRKRNKRTYYSYHVVFEAELESIELGAYLKRGELIRIAARIRDFVEQHG
jgi:hypothetical protein